MITCMDSAERPTVEEDDANALRDQPPGAAVLAGARSAPTSARSSRRPSDPRIPITGAGAGPIVVVGTTGDPATPLVGTEAMAAALEDGRLVVVDADQHTGYGTNECSSTSSTTTSST